MTPSNEVEYQLIGAVLDGLDDLYDERERADVWLTRLLTATGFALRGTMWERSMAKAAADLANVMLTVGPEDERNRGALEVTGDLRIHVAERWSELHTTGAASERGAT